MKNKQNNYVYSVIQTESMQLQMEKVRKRTERGRQTDRQTETETDGE